MEVGSRESSSTTGKSPQLPRNGNQSKLFGTGDYQPVNHALLFGNRRNENCCVSYVPFEFFDGPAADLMVRDDFSRTYRAVICPERNTFTMSRHVHSTLRRGNLGEMHVAKENAVGVRLSAACTTSLEPIAAYI